MSVWRSDTSAARAQARRSQRRAIVKLAKSAAKLADELNQYLAKAGDVSDDQLPRSTLPKALHCSSSSAYRVLEDVKQTIAEITGKTPLTPLFFDPGDYEQANPPGFPTTAWRVTTPDSRAKLDPEVGALVAAQHRIISCESKLREEVQNHLDPYSSKSSCFMSVFTDYERAQNWAQTRGPHDKVYITQVDMGKILEGIHVFDTNWLKQELQLDSCAMPGEFLILNRIPQQCLGKRRSLKDIYEEEALPGYSNSEGVADVKATAPDTLSETTSPQTQNRDFFMRHFKAPMSFSNGQRQSKLLRLENVPIAYHVNPWREIKYGEGYAYAKFPSSLRQLILTTCDRQRSTDVDDPSLGDETSEGWWKTISFNTYSFEDRREGAKRSDRAWSLRGLLESTKQGVVATLLISVSLMVQFEDQSDERLENHPDKSDLGTIGIDVRRGYITRSEVECGPVPYITPDNRRNRRKNATRLPTPSNSDGIMSLQKQTEVMRLA